MGVFDDLEDKKDDVENKAHEVKGRVDQKTDDMSQDSNNEDEVD